LSYSKLLLTDMKKSHVRAGADVLKVYCYSFVNMVNWLIAFCMFM